MVLFVSRRGLSQLEELKILLIGIWGDTSYISIEKKYLS